MQHSKWATNPIKSNFSSSYCDHGVLDALDNELEIRHLKSCLVGMGDRIQCLDLAAGHGRFSEAMLPRAKSIDIVDLEQKHLDFMRARFNNAPVHFHLDDALNFLTHTSGTYDVIVISGLLLFFDDPQAKRLLEMARTRLNKKGCIFVRDFISKQSNVSIPFDLEPTTSLHFRPRKFYDNLGAHSYRICRPHHRFIRAEKIIFGTLGSRFYKALCSPFLMRITWLRMPWRNYVFILDKQK